MSGLGRPVLGLNPLGASVDLGPYRDEPRYRFDVT